MIYELAHTLVTLAMTATAIGAFAGVWRLHGRAIDMRRTAAARKMAIAGIIALSVAAGMTGAAAAYLVYDARPTDNPPAPQIVQGQ